MLRAAGFGGSLACSTVENAKSSRMSTPATCAACSPGAGLLSSCLSDIDLEAESTCDDGWGPSHKV